MPGEDPLETAKREFEEETGFRLNGDFISLTPIQQKGGKKVLCWAMQGDINATKIASNTFEMQWPPRSGRMQLFPEIDKAGWFTYKEARVLINERQVPFLDELMNLL